MTQLRAASLQRQLDTSRQDIYRRCRNSRDSLKILLRASPIQKRAFPLGSGRAIALSRADDANVPSVPKYLIISDRPIC